MATTLLVVSTVCPPGASKYHAQHTPSASAWPPYLPLNNSSSQTPPSSQAAKWKAWINRLEIYFAALGVVEGREQPLMLHLAGEGIYDIMQSLTEATPNTYDTLKAALTAHFEPLANPDYELFMLRQARQKNDESVDEFYARLKKLAATYTLPDEQHELRAQFIQGCASNRLREKILQDPRRSMDDILTLGRSKELSKARVSHMEAALQTPVKVEPVNLVTKGRVSDKKDRPKPPPTTRNC